jgi:hypothetical protein
MSDEVEELHPGNDFEIIWAKLENKGSKTLYISSFYNPKTSDEKSLKNFDISVRTSQIKNAALFIGGDFNLPGHLAGLYGPFCTIYIHQRRLLHLLCLDLAKSLCLLQ